MNSRAGLVTSFLALMPRSLVSVLDAPNSQFVCDLAWVGQQLVCVGCSVSWIRQRCPAERRRERVYLRESRDRPCNHEPRDHFHLRRWVVRFQPVHLKGTMGAPNKGYHQHEPQQPAGQPLTCVTRRNEKLPSGYYIGLRGAPWMGRKKRGDSFQARS